MPSTAQEKPVGSRWRIGLVISVSLLAILVAGWVLWGRHAARDWQYRRTLAGANAMLQAGNFRAANLAAQQAFALKPTAAAPLKLLAAVALRAGNPAALVWQRQACEAADASSGDWLTLARYALGFGEIAVADEALSAIPSTERNTATWHELAGTVASRARSLGLAQAHFREAQRLDPRNPRHELNLAAVELASEDLAVATAARATIERLAKNPTLRLDALRNLLSDARVRGPSDRARHLAQELRQAPGATFDDRLRVLEEARRADPAAFRDELATMCLEANTQLQKVASLMRWMNAHGEAAMVIEWSRELPEAQRAEVGIAITLAEAFVLTHQWDALRSHVAEGDWGGVDFMRHAFRARAMAGDGPLPRSAPFRSEWEQSLVGTRGSYIALTILARQAQAWGWGEQAVEIWWILASRRSGHGEALKGLFQHYKTAGDTARLYAVARRILEVEPQNPIAKNNVAMFALLLGKDLPTAYALAAELHAAFPQNAALASTYALSLLKQNKPTEALAAMNAVPAAPAEHASIAFYRALVLAAVGQREDARATLTAAPENAALLPEEKELARAQLATP